MRYITLFITLLLFSACQNNVEKEKDSKSDNPMDDNWGGQVYTQKLIDQGYYEGDEVTKYSN